MHHRRKISEVGIRKALRNEHYRNRDARNKIVFEALPVIVGQPLQHWYVVWRALLKSAPCVLKNGCMGKAARVNIYTQ